MNGCESVYVHNMGIVDECSRVRVPSLWLEFQELSDTPQWSPQDRLYLGKTLNQNTNFKIKP